jgi:hypothetical protein
MQVISLKSNSRLIKGMVYEAYSFNNTLSTPGRYSRQSIEIKGFGWYLCKNFTDTNGNPLPQIQYTNSNKPTRQIIQADPNQLRPGDILVCNSDKFKYLVKGGKYRINEVKNPNTWSAQVKLEGYNRSIKFTNWVFRKLSTQESRDLALSQIFDQPENFSVEFVRKFDKESNKTKVLIQSLAKSILDPYRHGCDLIDWTIEKSKYQGFKREDFQEILDKPLSEILSEFENSSN